MLDIIVVTYRVILKGQKILFFSINDFFGDVALSCLHSYISNTSSFKKGTCQI